MSAVNTALKHYSIPDRVKEILEDNKCLNLDAKSSDFWIISRAVKEFVDDDSDGELPIGGRIPDMFSDSERYVQLQNVYREKAAEDAENILRRVQGLLDEIGRSPVSRNKNLKSLKLSNY